MVAMKPVVVLQLWMMNRLWRVLSSKKPICISTITHRSTLAYIFLFHSQKFIYAQVYGIEIRNEKDQYLSYVFALPFVELMQSWCKTVDILICESILQKEGIVYIITYIIVPVWIPNWDKQECIFGVWKNKCNSF